MAYMVSVFVGDENSIDIFQAEACRDQAFAKFTQAQAAINKHPRHLCAALRFDQGRVACAATAQVFKAQHRVTAVR